MYYKVLDINGINVIGLGIGFVVIKVLVIVMKGEIYVSSIEGEGSVFVVEILFKFCIVFIE